MSKSSSDIFYSPYYSDIRSSCNPPFPLAILESPSSSKNCYPLFLFMMNVTFDYQQIICINKTNFKQNRMKEEAVKKHEPFKLKEVCLSIGGVDMVFNPYTATWVQNVKSDQEKKLQDKLAKRIQQFRRFEQKAQNKMKQVLQARQQLQNEKEQKKKLDEKYERKKNHYQSLIITKKLIEEQYQKYPKQH